MKPIIDKLIKSFDTKADGFSARKLTAFTLVSCVVITHGIWWTKYDISKNIVEVLLTDFGMIAALFGMTTFEPKNKKDATESSKENI